jgi:hypothetical protein
MVAQAGKPLVPHTRSWAGPGISPALRVERLVRLIGGFTEGGFRFRIGCASEAALGAGR